MSNISDLSNAPRKVLIVDDEEDLREVIEFQLAPLGLQIVTAQNGLEAFGILQRERFDAVCSDITMPEMTGLDLLARVRSAGFETPFIILTGFGDKAKAVEALRLGAFDFLEKPWNPDKLRETIRLASEFGSKLRKLDEDMAKALADQTKLANGEVDPAALQQMKEVRKAILLMRFQQTLQSAKTGT